MVEFIPTFSKFFFEPLTDTKNTGRPFNTNNNFMVFISFTKYAFSLYLYKLKFIGKMNTYNLSV